MTRSLPLIRPSRACGFAAFLSTLPKRLKSLGEREVLYYGGELVSSSQSKLIVVNFGLDNLGEVTD